MPTRRPPSRTRTCKCSTRRPSSSQVHAYTPATEPYADWAHFDRNSKEYREAKEAAVEVLWQVPVRPEDTPDDGLMAS
jgi:hypothetical protein